MRERLGDDMDDWTCNTYLKIHNNFNLLIGRYPDERALGNVSKSRESREPERETESQMECQREEKMRDLQQNKQLFIAEIIIAAQRSGDAEETPQQFTVYLGISKK